MGIEETHRLGYQRVDDDPNVSVLLSTMDATAGWDATRRLRSWERDPLNLRSGQRLLDVGCGLGEAALALADDLGDDGELVGVDVSAQMLRVARSNAAAAPCRVRFTIGDACSLAEPDDSFDVVRSERTLQWLADPVAAVTEMVRVAAPGGRVSLIDTDWSTFAIDVGDDDLAARVREAMRTERGRPSNIGGRLHEVIGALDCVAIGQFHATHTWTAWNPDEARAPDGCFSMRSLADDLVATGQVSSADRARFVSTIEHAARRNRFSMQLTMYAVVAETPNFVAAAHGVTPANCRSRRSDRCSRTCHAGSVSSHAPPGYDCPFCRNIRTGEADYPLEIVSRSPTVFVKINPRWRPNNPGSALVMPVDHYENIFDLPDALVGPIHSAARSAAASMKVAFGCDGISLRQHNEPAGSQDVWHYHLHVIPRWRHDEFDRHPATATSADEIQRRAQQLRDAWPARDTGVWANPG